MKVFASDSRDDFLTFYKQIHTRMVEAVFVKWPRWLSLRGKNSSLEVNLSQKQIHPMANIASDKSEICPLCDFILF